MMGGPSEGVKYYCTSHKYSTYNPIMYNCSEEQRVYSWSVYVGVYNTGPEQGAIKSKGQGSVVITM